MGDVRRLQPKWYSMAIWVIRVLWCLWQVKGSYRFVIKGPSEEGVWFLDLKGQQGTITYGDKVRNTSLVSCIKIDASHNHTS